MPSPLPRPLSRDADSNSNSNSTSNLNLNLNPNQNPTPSSSALSSLSTAASSATAATASPTAIVHGSSRVGLLSDDEQDGLGDGDGDGDSIDGASDAPRRHYRPKKALPPELKEHCRVYLEEALPRQAISLLDSLLSTRASDPREPAYCPPPSQISLLCSLLVHPDFTTRPREPDWPQISLQALVYLRDLLSVLGPVNAAFKEAVLFGTNATSDLDFESHPPHNDDALDVDERGLVRLSPRHGNDSVWQRGRDFFSVVGWALNCSFLYPERWQWWARWLGFMLDLLEADLQERHRLDMQNDSDDMPLLQNSILASYIAQRSGRTTDVVMWIMKALFADGSMSSTSVFQEIWYREHKCKSRRAANKRKRDKVNIDKGEYGGYLDDESVHSSQASEPPTPQKKRTEAAWAQELDFETLYIETVSLRQRLFSLVSYLCYGLGDASPIDFSSLYEKFEQRIKELPLAIFSSFINHSTSSLRTDQQIETLQGVLFLFLPAGALSPRKVDRVRFEEGGISPAILERCFLPYPANTIEVEDHVKMSLLLENLLMIVWTNGENEGFSGDLAQAVEKGVAARWEKINKKKTRGRGRGPGDADREARAALEASGARLQWLVAAIEESAKAEGEDAMDAMDEDEAS
ncbi:hypothetical protein F5Y14DRAFT_441001 [Nemania sp. NC0429]|nr:hypothetical protein F5Y14DRAFT_441001 [Nemania sp. NC0429]